MLKYLGWRRREKGLNLREKEREIPFSPELSAELHLEAAGFCSSDK